MSDPRRLLTDDVLIELKRVQARRGRPFTKADLVKCKIPEPMIQVNVAGGRLGTVLRKDERGTMRRHYFPIVIETGPESPPDEGT